MRFSNYISWAGAAPTVVLKPHRLFLKQPGVSPDQSQRQGSRNHSPALTHSQRAGPPPRILQPSIHHAAIIPAFSDEVLKFTVLRPVGLAGLLLQISYVSSITLQRPWERQHQHVAFNQADIWTRNIAGWPTSGYKPWSGFDRRCPIEPLELHWNPVWQRPFFL